MRGQVHLPVLDRLLDLDEAEFGGATSGRHALRTAVLRDIGWMLNEVAPPERIGQSMLTVLDWGLPPLAGRVRASLDADSLARIVRERLLAFEPRLLPGSVTVEPVGASGEGTAGFGARVTLRIEGELAWQPAPLRLVARGDLDLESGRIQLVPVAMG